MIDDKEKTRIALKVSLMTIIVNAILAIIKAMAGIFGHSMAMLSDALHSLSDVLSTFVVIIGVKLGKSDIDDDHPYGHERIESIAGIVLAFLLFSTGIGIGYAGAERIVDKSYLISEIPTSFALYAAILSLLIKEAMYWYTWIAAKKINSDVLMADAWHHRSDALSSVGAFIGIIGARHGFPLLDPLASLLICVFICKVAYDIFIASIDKVVDKAVAQEKYSEMYNFVLNQQGVKAIDSLKTRVFGQKVYIDLEIAVDATLSVIEAHDISEKVHNALEEKFKEIKHCMVHVNPI